MSRGGRTGSLVRGGAASLVLLGVLSSARAQSEPAPTRAELDKLLAATDEIAAKVSKVRGLSIKRPIARGVMTREQIEERVSQRLAEEYAEGDLDKEQRALERLGLFPPGLDYKQSVMEILAEQIAGFYDPQVKSLFLADWLPVESQRMVMIHEIGHALQDQHHDLVAYTKPVRDNMDAALARQAVVEGDGLAIMIEIMTRESGAVVDPWSDPTLWKSMLNAMDVQEPEGALAKAPLVLRESLMFPYAAGLGLVAELRHLHPWSRVDQLFTHPPASTEQVLHPQKLVAGERPVAIAPGAIPTLAGWKPIFTNVLGEMMFGVFLREHGVPKDAAREAAEGWGGDRVQVLAPPGDAGKGAEELVLVDVSSWDSEIEASEAAEALASALQTLTKSASPCAAPDPTATWVSCTDPTGDVALVDRKGAKIVLLLGAPADKAGKIRLETWAKWRVGR